MSMPSIPSMYSIGEENDSEQRASCTDLLEEIFDEQTDASPTNAFTTTMHSIKTNKVHRAIATSGEFFTKLVRRSEIRRRQTRSGALPTYMLDSIVTPYPCQAASPDDHEDSITSSPSMNTTLQTTILAMLENDRRYSPVDHVNGNVKGSDRRSMQSVSAVELQSNPANPTLLLRAHTVVANTSKTPPTGAQRHMLTAIQRQSEYASPTMQLVEFYDVKGDEESICTTDTSLDGELTESLFVIPT